MIFKISGFLVFFRHEKVEYVTWYNETKTVSQSQETSRRKQQRALLSCNSTWNITSSKFSWPSDREVQSQHGRPSVIFEDVWRVSSYFNVHLRTLLRIVKCLLGSPRCSIQLCVQNRLHLLSYRLHIIQLIEEREYESRTAFANLYLQNVESDSLFLNIIIFFGLICLSRWWKSQPTRCRYFGAWKSSSNVINVPQ